MATVLAPVSHEENLPTSINTMLATLSDSPNIFLQPTPSLHAASIVLAKRYLDPLATSISELQQTRQQENRRKRKRNEKTPDGREQVLQLRQVYTDGFTVDQVWEQARRVLEATTKTVEGELLFSHSRNVPTGLATETGEPLGYDGPQSDEIEDAPDDPDSGLDEDLEDEAMPDQDAPLSNVDEEGAAYDEPPISEDAEDEFIKDPNGLNDPFFNIDDFNRQTQFLEKQDEKGDLDDGAASDEEEIDWAADHLSQKPLSSAIKARSNDGDEEDGSDEEIGPTFGDADEGDEWEDDEMEGEVDSMGNTNDIKYSDFFAPPALKKSKSTGKRALPKTQPLDQLDNTFEDDTERAMADVRRDLFDDDMSTEDDSYENPSNGNSRTNLSTHEKQKAKLAQEIRRLEAANVAKREWVLSGEAKAADRPMDSLIEEDLEFERTGKPVPVITNEVSEEIEDLIKRRILAKEFDELIRRHPESVQEATKTRRGLVELDDTKAQQSLAELYEEDHLRATDPNFVDKKDAKLKKEHDEISRLWQDISSKLDTLSNWHYKPRPQHASINVISDVPTISMEDARPSASGEASGEQSMLAPQEVYAPGDEGKAMGEVVLKGGATMAKGEMTREEKLRRRRREKERMKKSGGPVPLVTSKTAQERQDVLRDLKKGGVKVIGKKGDVKDVDGRKLKPQKGVKSADALKL